jgi:hypothetical protein
LAAAPDQKRSGQAIDRESTSIARRMRSFAISQAARPSPIALVQDV